MTDLNNFFLKKNHNWIMFSITFIASIVALITGYSNLDYDFYTKIWQSILNGNNPWDPHIRNAYGPAFNLLAPFYSLHPLLPKIIFVWCWCWISHKLILSLFISQKKSTTGFQIIYFIILFNPFFWARVCIQGVNETVVAFFCFLAIRNTTEKKPITAGIWISLGFLFKFYPLALLPIISKHNGKFNLKLILSTMFFICTSCLLSYLIWGKNSLDPLLFATNRGSAGDSIFNFIKSEYFFFSETSRLNFDWLSKYLIILFCSLIIIVHWTRTMKTEAASTLMMLSIFTFYLSGMNQYQLIVYVLALEWITKEKDLLQSNKILQIAFISYFSYNSLIRPSLKLLWDILIKNDSFFKVLPLLSFPVFLFLILAIFLSQESLANCSKSK